MTINDADLESALDGAFSQEQPVPSVQPSEAAVPAPVETSPQTQATEPAPNGVEPVADPGQPPKRSMLDDLREERARRKELAQQIEALRKEGLEREQRYLEAIQRGQVAPKERPQPKPRPDVFQDPDGAFVHLEQQLEQRMIDRVVAMSEASARRQYGDEKVNAALNAAKQAGIAAQFQYAADPFGELVDWHRKVTTLQTIGPDPDAWRKSEREKLKAEILEEMKAQGSQFVAPGQQQQKPRFPGTLADGTATGAQGAHLNPENVMDDVFRRK